MGDVRNRTSFGRIAVLISRGPEYRLVSSIAVGDTAVSELNIYLFKPRDINAKRLRKFGRDNLAIMQ